MHGSCPPESDYHRKHFLHLSPCFGQQGYMDRVNMYSSFYCAIRKAHAE